MILLSDLFSLVVWSRSLGSNNPESLMNTHINVPGAGREIIGSSMGSSASHGPSISTAQAVVLLFSALLLPIFVPDSETQSASAAHVSVFIDSCHSGPQREAAQAIVLL